MLEKGKYHEEIIAGRGKTPEALRNQEVGVDLAGKIDHEIESELKHDAMRVREIVLEQDRMAAILLDKFSFLESSEELDAYCEKLGIEEGVKLDLQAMLPRLREMLSKGGEVFSQEILEDEAENFEEIYHAFGSDAKKLFAGEGAGEMVQTIVSAEIDLALQALSHNRSRKRLSHRGREFGKDEASVESFEAMLRANVAEFEFDTRVSADHKNINHHNSTLGESAGLTKYIRDLTVEQLSEISYKGGETICTLKKLFELVLETKNTTTKINIDIKDFDEQALDEILELVHEYDMEHRVAIVSWLPQSLQYLYEKDSTLEYSLSYFPVIRGIPSFVIDLIEKIPSGSRALGVFGTAFAKMRTNSIKGIKSENISDATILQGNEHWRKTIDRLRKKGKDLIGRHTVPHTELPVADEWGDMEIMARVLQKGSVNIMSLEAIAEGFVDTLQKIPLLGDAIKLYRQEFIGAICATDSMLHYAEQLQTNGIKVNIFDVKEEGRVDKYIEKMNQAGIEPGVVYYSGKFEGLHTRNQLPKIPAPQE
jgi:hypothetical protein